MDFHDDRNVIVVAVSLGLAMIPVAFPTFYKHFGPDVQTIVGSGITMGSLSAIMLNLVFNVLGGDERGDGATLADGDRLSIEQVNALGDEEFAATFAPLFQGSLPIAAEVAARRPFDSLYDMRHAFHSVLFDEPDERGARADRLLPGHRGQGLARPGVARATSPGRAWTGSRPTSTSASTRSTRPTARSSAHPFLICVRENTKETILDDVRAPDREHAAPGAAGGARGDRQDRQPAAARPGRGRASTEKLAPA